MQERRLLDDEVFPRAERPLGQLEMQMRRREHERDVHIVARERGLVGAEGTYPAELPIELLGLGRIPTRVLERHAVDGAQRRRVHARREAAPQHRDAQRRRGHASVSSMWSAARRELATIVRLGFTAAAVGMKLPSST